ncbi:tRNA pseudouridine(55) synthase TruB [Rhizobiales bacterium]|uniref:tRNA pseudouridine(55) synthase TruB n=1 Tax=Hongsoonwoonella zoysiae TaxID=2821844 RepID=UPI0015600264|nr:tRNA pseudouridine(55) synthase TruB [Hongsoonwoonella zoysiae]NRG16542.1 tRNA pseudouridine(55) synthase TruB [Hongsoonwoonella zoysiae]
MAQAKKKKRNRVDGWLVLDKPAGLTSNDALNRIKRLIHPEKVGHAGTLDPLASGLLPLAFGEATKTVPFVMDGRKVYSFEVTWGAETETDDTEGDVTETSNVRPTEDDILAVLPEFQGTIMQVPPKYSAIKIGGERAYKLARAGEDVEIEARPIDVHRLDLVECPDENTAIFEAECGKGTYVRALARDIARKLGTRGHVTALRRLVVGPFGEDDMIMLENLEELGQCAPGLGLSEDHASLFLPVETALDDIPALAVSRADAALLRKGQSVLLRGRDAPAVKGLVSVSAGGELVALGEVVRGAIQPKRVFNLAPAPAGAVVTMKE